MRRAADALVPINQWPFVALVGVRTLDLYNSTNDDSLDEAMIIILITKSDDKN